jgi:hypothetical protein
VYDTVLLRDVCHQLAVEEDPDRIDQLICLLRAVVKDNQEEVKIRMAFLARQYAHFFTECKPESNAAA